MAKGRPVKVGAVRAAELLRMHEAGASIRELARLERLAQATVHKTLKRAKGAAAEAARKENKAMPINTELLTNIAERLAAVEARTAELPAEQRAAVVGMREEIEAIRTLASLTSAEFAAVASDDPVAFGKLLAANPERVAAIKALAEPEKK